WRSIIARALATTSSRLRQIRLGTTPWWTTAGSSAPARVSRSLRRIASSQSRQTISRLRLLMVSLVLVPPQGRAVAGRADHERRPDRGAACGRRAPNAARVARGAAGLERARPGLDLAGGRRRAGGHQAGRAQEVPPPAAGGRTVRLRVRRAGPPRTRDCLGP